MQQIVREISVEDTASYRNLMRIDVAKFRQLAEIIAPGVSKKPIVMRTPISVLHRLAEIFDNWRVVSQPGRFQVMRPCCFLFGEKSWEQASAGC